MTNIEAIKIIELVYERQVRDTFKLAIKDPVFIDIEVAFNMAIEALEQESILDKIRAEIEHMACRQYDYKLMLDREDVFKVFDKYRGESDCRECKVEHDCYECKKYAESEEK